ncbi:Response regulator rcp1 [Rubripirellula amarantea]|uniref:Response regulator rcp1 n=2 Tax=Rubripirellula amarantea TaxID=2527999 RepID=A0A5C5WJ58_9BACT|nr:Response regulator rcp1 [Rubripirellula amarantea]
MHPEQANLEKPIRCVMLVDDDSTDNFLHTRLLNRSGIVDEILVFEDAEAALDYLRAPVKQVDLICLDINMPRMTGLEFVNEFEGFWDPSQKKPLIVILTTSVEPSAIELTKKVPRLVAAEPKPLRLQLIETISKKYFRSDEIV